MMHSTGLVLMVLEKTGGGSLEPSSGSGYTFTEACSVAVGGGGVMELVPLEKQRLVCTCLEQSN